MPGFYKNQNQVKLLQKIKILSFIQLSKKKEYFCTQNNTIMSKQKSSRGRLDTSSKKNTQNTSQDAQDGIRLNKYIAHAGICSRRQADAYIKSGIVTVNGKVITEMGHKVQIDSEVRFDSRLISPELKRYVLLNKPKNYITTVEDDRGRKTVMDLIAKASKERLYPVGRLDRKTTGLLLFTNDGELTKKLTHPKHDVRKLYHVNLDKKLTMNHLKEIADTSFKIEDKRVFVDAISYIENKPKNEIGIEIHSGRNRIIRKIFESLGYTVVKLDRTVLAGLTKKDLPRGFWRHLTPLEVSNLKMIK